MTLTLRDTNPDQLHVGLTASFHRHVTQNDIDLFGDVSWDMNPLHIDEAYASSTQFRGRIAHGAFQNAMVSALVGMLLPGRQTLVTGITSRFLQALPVPAKVMVRGELTAWNKDQSAGIVSTSIIQEDKGIVVSEAEVGVTLHDLHTEPDANSTHKAFNIETQNRTGKRPANPDASCILVTGASGGIGVKLVDALAKEATILAVGRSEHHRSEMSLDGTLVSAAIDLTANDAFDRLRDFVGDRTLDSIVHVAWPGMPRGGLLQASRDTIGSQVSFASNVLVELARLMTQCCGADGGSIVAIGSSVGHHSPNPAIGVYSLGKAVLEDTARLLATELAIKRISINVLAPTTISTGINSAISERQKLMEQAQIPMARLCTEADVIAGVRFLTSPEGRYISGQTVVLAGGQI